MSIESKMMHVQFKRKAEQLMNDLALLVSLVPQKGDKAEDCQHITLKNALCELDSAINGVTHEDFIED